MRTASCLTLIAIGAIFTFAVTAHPSFLNLQIAGVVIMVTGAAGFVLPRRNQPSWLRRRTILRQGPHGPVVSRVDETRLPPYVMLNPGASPREGNGAQPGDLTTPGAAAGTVPDLPAEGMAAEPGSVVVDDPEGARSEIVEEDVEEEYVEE
jgi:hypothetical protein